MIIPLNHNSHLSSFFPLVILFCVFHYPASDTNAVNYSFMPSFQAALPQLRKEFAYLSLIWPCIMEWNL